MRRCTEFVPTNVLLFPWDGEENADDQSGTEKYGSQNRPTELMLCVEVVLVEITDAELNDEVH